MGKFSLKVSRQCYTLLRRLRNRVDQVITKSYYFAHVHALISYGLICGGSRFSDVHRFLNSSEVSIKNDIRNESKNILQDTL